MSHWGHFVPGITYFLQIVWVIGKNLKVEFCTVLYMITTEKMITMSNKMKKKIRIVLKNTT